MPEKAETYSECAPAVDQASIGNNERSTVTGDELGELSIFWEVVGIDGSRLGFRRVQPFSIVIGIAVRAIVVGNVLHLSFLSSLAAQSTLIVDTPGQYLVIVGKSSTVHAANCELDNANCLRGQQMIEAGTLDIDRLLAAIVFAGPQSELASRALTKDVDIELLCGNFVDSRNDLDPRGSDCLGFRTLVERD